MALRFSFHIGHLRALVFGALLAAAGCDEPSAAGPADAAITGPMCPGQVLASSSEPCCVDDRTCVSLGKMSLGASIVEVSLESLCAAGQCPSTLAEALADPRCSAAVSACGTVRVELSGVGAFGAPSVTYDAATGAPVQAYVLSNELYTRKIDGCCGSAFHGGATTTCPASVPVGCTSTSN